MHKNTVNLIGKLADAKKDFQLLVDDKLYHTIYDWAYYHLEYAEIVGFVTYIYARPTLTLIRVREVQYGGVPLTVELIKGELITHTDDNKLDTSKYGRIALRPKTIACVLQRKT